jgi:hypothetical protein
LVPQQAWELDFEAKKNLKAWGSATLRLYGRWIDDFIDIIPVAGGESRGNIQDQADALWRSLTTTLNLDPLGWKGARINANGRIEDSTLRTPHGEDRRSAATNLHQRRCRLRWDYSEERLGARRRVPLEPQQALRAPVRDRAGLRRAGLHVSRSSRTRMCSG